MFSTLFTGLKIVLTPSTFLLITAGTILGVIFGAMPGVSASMAVALALPFAYAMNPVIAIAFLVAVYCASITGGGITAILFRIPGTPSSAPTTFDGYPMAQRGEAGKALGFSLVASAVGGLIAAFAMALISPQLSAVALKFGPSELFAVSFLGLSVLSCLDSGNIVKTLISGLLGLFLACVGMDPMLGIARFTWGNSTLLSGIEMIPVMIGLGMNPFINAQGFGRTGMMTTLLGAVINLILDPLFIFVLGMGVRGAALATVIAQVCSAAWVLAFLTGRRAILRLDRGSLGLDGPILRRVCGLGLTGFTFSVTNSLVQALGNAQLQAYGTAAGMGDLYVAAMTAIVSVREIVMQPVRGLTQGAQPVIGYNYGAGQYSRVRRSILFLTVAGLSYNLAVWLLILAIPHVFILLFNNDPVLLEVGVKTMRVYYAGYVMMAFQMIGQNTFVALGRAKNAVFFSLFRKAILVVPLMLILPRLWNLGAYGIFASEPVSDIVGGLACYITMMLTVWPDMRKPDKVREEN